MKLMVNFCYFTLFYFFVFMIFGGIAYMGDIEILGDIISWTGSHPLPFNRLTKNIYLYFVLNSFQWYIIFLSLKYVRQRFFLENSKD